MTTLAAALSLTAGFSYAQAPAGSGSAFNAANPYVWTPKHPGEVPPLDIVQAARAWNATHHSVSIDNVTNPGGELLTYNGGLVMDSQVKVYLVFYGNQWGTKSTDAKGDYAFSNDPDGAASAVQEFFKGIGTGNELWSADLTQYCDSSSTTSVSTGATSCPNGASFIPYQSGGILAGVWYDNSAASPSAATSLQLGQEADAAAAHFGNTTAASNRYTYYVILSPTGANPDNYNGQYCAWHDSNADVGTNKPYGELAFSNQPYNMDTSVCGKNFVNSGAAGTLDGYTMTLGHEWQEMMTDTYPENLGWFNANWQSPSGQKGAEIGDECAWISPGQDGGAGNVTFGTGTFAMQSHWSNDSNDCVLSHKILQGGGGSTGGTPSANFSFTTSGLTANFTDSSTDSGGTISAHSWTFGDSGTSTATNPSHAYAKAGTYSVTETITDSASGKTNSKTESVTVTAPSTGGTPSASFTDTTNGLTATFTDTSTDSGGTISAHSWAFGDGGTSSATSPSHTYAKAGTYSVTETVTDSVNGKTNSATKSVTVSSSSGGGVWTGGESNLSASAGGYVYYSVAVPAGATNLKFVTSGPSGDIAWLFIGKGYQPSLFSYDYESENFGTSQSIVIASPAAATYQVAIWAGTSFSGVNLTVTYNKP